MKHKKENKEDIDVLNLFGSLPPKSPHKPGVDLNDMDRQALEEAIETKHNIHDDSKQNKQAKHDRF